MHLKIQRFDFGSLRDFTQPETCVPLPAMEEEAPPPPPPPIFSESELQAARESAREAGYQAGFLAGEAEAIQKSDALAQRSQQAMEALAQELATLDARYAATLAEQSQLVGQLSLAIAQKVAGDALHQHTVDAIQTLVTQCLPAVLNKPRLIIELHPETMAVAEAPLRAVIHSYHYEGELVFRGNTALGAFDARMDWESGHASRNTQELWEKVEELILKLPTPIALAPTPETVTIDSRTTPMTGEDHG